LDVIYTLASYFNQINWSLAPEYGSCLTKFDELRIFQEDKDIQSSETLVFCQCGKELKASLQTLLRILADPYVELACLCTELLILRPETQLIGIDNELNVGRLARREGDPFEVF
jgi:hypothetical protein